MHQPFTTIYKVGLLFRSWLIAFYNWLHWGSLPLLGAYCRRTIHHQPTYPSTTIATHQPGLSRCVTESRGVCGCSVKLSLAWQRLKIFIEANSSDPMWSAPFEGFGWSNWGCRQSGTYNHHPIIMMSNRKLPFMDGTPFLDKPNY